MGFQGEIQLGLQSRTSCNLMGFGAIIASGDNNELLSQDLMDCVTEVRVEQSLDEPTRLPSGFRRTLRMASPASCNHPSCNASKSSPSRSSKRCAGLPRARTDHRTQIFAHTRGPGSWYEIRGMDRRIEMSRVCYQKCWEGRASEAVSQIFEPVWV